MVIGLQQRIEVVDEIGEEMEEYAATKKMLLDVDVADITRFEEELFEFIKTKYPEIPEGIKTDKEIKEDNEAKLKKALEEFKEQFS